jgi:hypothetical protein
VRLDAGNGARHRRGAQRARHRAAAGGNRPGVLRIIEGSNISTIPTGAVDTGVGPLTGTGNGAVAAAPPLLPFSALVGIGALWVIGAGLRRQRTALR